MNPSVDSNNNLAVAYTQILTFAKTIEVQSLIHHMLKLHKVLLGQGIAY